MFIVSTGTFYCQSWKYCSVCDVCRLCWRPSKK